MIDAFKKSWLGQYLYTLSRLPRAGWPLRMIARFVQSEAFRPAHLRPSNIAHNKHQRRVLTRFEGGVEGRSK